MYFNYFLNTLGNERGALWRRSAPEMGPQAKMLLPSRKYNVFQRVHIQVPKQTKTLQNAYLAFTHKTNEIINILKLAKNAPFDSDTNIPAKLNKIKNIYHKNNPKYPPGTPTKTTKKMILAKIRPLRRTKTISNH